MSPDLALFVPAILGAGLLFSLGALARDAIHRLRGRRWLDRRSALDGHEAAVYVTMGEEAARRDSSGRLPRRLYGLSGLGFVLLAVYLALGSYGNYIGWTGWVATIGWIWLAYLLCIVGFLVVGVAVGSIAIWWDRPPAWTHPLLSRTPFGRLPPRRRVVPVTHLPLAGPAEHLSLRERLTRVVRVDERAAETARVAAGLWSAAVVVTLSVLALQDYLPRADDPATIELAVSGPVQVGLLLLFGLSSLLASRHGAAGSAAMVGTAAGLAVLSAIQYPPWMAAIIITALGGPAFLHWLAWQRDRHLHHLAFLLLASVATVGMVVAAADKLADRTIGPAHPASSRTALPPSAVTWVWAGGTTERSTVVVAQMTRPTGGARLAVSPNADLSDATYSAPQAATDTGQRIVRFPIEGLTPDTEYHYAVEVDGTLDRVRTGRVRTFPSGAASFTVAVGSCARSGSNGAVFDAIAAQNPLLYLNAGDVHYANIDDDDTPPFVDALASALTAPSQSALYRSTSTGYIWDDHDYGGNDADRTSPSRAAAQAAYRMSVPHYPLDGREQGGPVYQAFTVGRVRFIVTDARSERDPATGATAPSMLGATQLAWFEEELRRAAASPQAVVWVNASPWIDAALPGADTWAGFAAERSRLSDTIASLGLTDRMLMVSGDAHMVGFDDGTNSNFGTSAASAVKGIPVFHAAALDRPGGVKGGPYSDPTFPGAGQFGTVAVADTGGATIEVTVTGRTWDGRVLLEHTLPMAIP